MELTLDMSVGDVIKIWCAFVAMFVVWSLCAKWAWLGFRWWR